MELGWIRVKVGDGIEQVLNPSLLFSVTLCSSSCVAALSLLCKHVSLLLLCGLVSVRGALNIQWLAKPNYHRLLALHRGSQTQTVYL